jgi:hypothetical protein
LRASPLGEELGNEQMLVTGIDGQWRQRKGDG